MVTPQLGDWGLGLRVSGDGDALTFSHGGENHGYECAMFGAVRSQNAAAIMTSSDQGVPVLEAMSAAIMASSCWQTT